MILKFWVLFLKVIFNFDADGSNAYFRWIIGHNILLFYELLEGVQNNENYDSPSLCGRTGDRTGHVLNVFSFLFFLFFWCLAFSVRIFEPSLGDLSRMSASSVWEFVMCWLSVIACSLSDNLWICEENDQIPISFRGRHWTPVRLPKSYATHEASTALVTGETSVTVAGRC